MDSAESASGWVEALRAAALLAVDPVGLGGVCVRARAGPARDGWLAHLREAMPGAPVRRVPLNIADSRLLGGIDLTASLAAGRRIAERGVLAQCDGGVLVLAMAERISPTMAARLAGTLDEGVVRTARDGIEAVAQARVAVVALDEGIEADERPPECLRERLAFHLDLDTVSRGDMGAGPAGEVAVMVARARAMLPLVCVPDELRDAAVGAAASLGIASLRAPLLAVRTMRAAAALDGCMVARAEDGALAARLVLGPRATRLPPAGQEAEAEQDAGPPGPAEAGGDDAPGDARDGDGGREDGDGRADPPGDLMVAAALAAMPAGLLERLRAGGMGAGGRGSGAGQVVAGLRGRPAGVRAAAPGPRARLDLLETLRAAAPWQKLRAVAGQERRMIVRGGDFRVRQYRQRRESVTIFVVDVSGSSALNRLAEAKGAVELLLADCYVRRDSVALIAFRGQAASVVLPPTRALARARRSLAGVAGGGGTPMASAIDGAAALAEAVRRRGGTPGLVFLSDGIANIARDGSAGRAGARADALAAARGLGRAGHAAIFVDTAPSPRGREAGAVRPARDLADAMGARYVALPRASAAGLDAIVRAARAA